MVSVFILDNFDPFNHLRWKSHNLRSVIIEIACGWLARGYSRNPIISYGAFAIGRRPEIDGTTIGIF